MIPIQDCKWLILVPTQLELDRIRSCNATCFNRRHTRVELCGFGPIASAAKSSELIFRHSPHQVMLLGIAGSYNEETRVGAAYTFKNVACFGVGIGFGNDYRSAESMGWPQWSENNTDQIIGDLIALESEMTDAARNTLVTGTTASNSLGDVRQRTLLINHADAEDMEGYAVAVACKFAKLPLTIVRGISNRSADRDIANWRIDEALGSASRLAEEIIG